MMLFLLFRITILMSFSCRCSLLRMGSIVFLVALMFSGKLQGFVFFVGQPFLSKPFRFCFVGIQPSIYFLLVEIQPFVYFETRAKDRRGHTTYTVSDRLYPYSSLINYLCDAQHPRCLFGYAADDNYR